MLRISLNKSQWKKNVKFDSLMLSVSLILNQMISFIMHVEIWALLLTLRGCLRVWQHFSSNSSQILAILSLILLPGQTRPAMLLNVYIENGFRSRLKMITLKQAEIRMQDPIIKKIQKGV